MNFDPSDRSELSSIHGTSSFIYKSLHVRQFEMSSYPSRYSGISLHSQREIFSSLQPDFIRFILPIIENRIKKKSFKISKIRFLMVHQKLIFIFLVSFGHGDETGHWCKGESQRNYEVIVSPRLVDSVPCLELYRSGKIYLIDFIYAYLRR